MSNPRDRDDNLEPLWPQPGPTATSQDPYSPAEPPPPLPPASSGDHPDPFGNGGQPESQAYGNQTGAPTDYGARPAYTVPPEYGNPTGYTTPPDSSPPSYGSYGSLPGYGSSAGYGSPPTYGSPPNYGSPPSAGSPSNYGRPPGYAGPPGYGGPSAGYESPAPPPPDGEAGTGRSRWLPVAIIAALIGALVGGGVGAAVARNANTASSTPTTVVRPVLAPNATIAKPQSVPAILAKVEPGVVSVTTNIGAGTGMILTADGQVLTNYHVVQGATAIKVTLFNETAGRAATVKGFDRSNDVALLQITGASALPTVKLGDSDALQVGDDVIAVGNALNLAGGPTVTAGIISAKGRTVDPTAPSNLLQTDAAINPGNSGGPLVNANGEVVGMNTLVIQQATAQEAAQNLGFAIPINTIKPLVPDLAQGVQRTPAYLGVGVVTLTPDIAQRFGISATQGAIIQDLPIDGPASKAGLQQSDVITSFDGQKVTTDSGLVQLIHAHKPGDKVVVGYARGTKTGTATVTLGTTPNQ